MNNAILNLFTPFIFALSEDKMRFLILKMEEFFMQNRTDNRLLQAIHPIIPTLLQPGDLFLDIERRYFYNC